MYHTTSAFTIAGVSSSWVNTPFPGHFVVRVNVVNVKTTQIQRCWQGNKSTSEFRSLNYGMAGKAWWWTSDKLPGQFVIAWFDLHLNLSLLHMSEIGRMLPLFVARSAYVLPAVRWSSFRRDDCCDWALNFKNGGNADEFKHFTGKAVMGNGIQLASRR